jgi:hypothetical protein
MPRKVKIQKLKVKKLKKTHNDIKINIKVDNSRKSTTRRSQQQPLLDPKLTPFVNFPSHQPTRQVITEVQPKNYNSPDLTKTMDEYQKQIKEYLETRDKSVKDMIETFDDTLKKNIAPPATPKSPYDRPGAYNVYADRSGDVVFEEENPLRKWTNKNEMKSINLNNNVNELKANQLLVEPEPEDVEVKPLDTSELIRNAPRGERQKAKAELKQVDLDENKIDAYNNYKMYWEQLNPDKEFDFSVDKYTTNNWVKEGNRLKKKLEKQLEMQQMEEIERNSKTSPSKSSKKSKK